MRKRIENGLREPECLKSQNEIALMKPGPAQGLRVSAAGKSTPA
jgi:hypothetical protein